ncbi:MAG: S-layer homology domain-containing protein [Paenibacillus sp.]|nr:S-layer homology domain-containing protein [Paenibacillus sp.]
MSDMSYPTKENTKFMIVQGGEKKVMKKILSVALSTAMAFSMFASVAFGETATTPEAQFTALAAKGILNGYPDGQAHLEKDLTRAEFAKIISKLFDLSEITTTLSYKDKNYNANHWARGYIEAVTKAGLMNGRTTTTFDPSGKVTVQEVATVLARGLKLQLPAATSNTASAWAKQYVQAVIDKGLLASSVNFQGNANRALVVSAAYAVDVLKSAPVVVSAEALSPTSVLVTFADKTTTTVALTTALVQGTETTINFKYNGFDLTAKVTLTAPKVLSVNAPNSKQLVVKFNRPMDSTTVVPVNMAVYGLGTATPATISASTISLSSDKTEATLTLGGSEYFKGQYTFTVTESVKTAAGEKVAPYTTLVTVADTMAPTISSLTSVAKATTTKVTVKFSEPVQSTGVIAYVNGVAAGVVAGSSLNELVLNTGTLVSGKTYDVSFLNVQDFAGNYITPNPTATTVTVVSELDAPAITSFTVSGENTVKVVFNKAVDINSLQGIISLLDASGINKGNFTATAGSDSKTFTLTAPAFAFTNNVFNGTAVIGAGIRDTLGNITTASSTQAVSFTKDTVAPTVVSATYGTTGLVVKFSEKVSIPNNSFTLINDATGNASTVTVSAATYTIANDTDVTFTNVTGFAAGNYTLRLPAGLVKDTSAQANGNAASVHTVAINATSTTDSTKPAVVVAPTTGVAVGNDQVITFGLSDANGLNISTVRNINNYTLDGKALPAGSYITTNYSSSTPAATVTVTLYVPTSGISATKGNYAFVINGIQDTAGNVITPYVSNSISLVDGVAPALTSAGISADDSKKLIINFSESVSGVNAADLEIKVNGIVANVTDADITPASGSKYFVSVNALQGTYNGSSVLYFENGTAGVQAGEIIAYTSDAAGALDLNAVYVNTVTVNVKSTATIVDGATNGITTGTTVSAK